MDWLRSDDSLWDKNMEILDFVPAESTVLVVAKQGKVCVSMYCLLLTSRKTDEF